MKKVKILITIFISAIFLVSCSSTTKNTDTKDTKKIQEKGLKMTVIASGSGISDGASNQSTYEGIIKFMEKNKKAEVTVVNESTGKTKEAEKSVEEVVSKYNAIITSGYQFKSLSKVAEKNPKKFFIMVDSVPDKVKGKAEFENILSLRFRDEESGFLAGVSAALETKTNKVGFVGGITNSSAVNYQLGFESGINYANKIFKTKAKIVEIDGFEGSKSIKGNYVGNLDDQEKGAEIGNLLMEQETDVIFVAAGNAGKGVFEAVKASESDTKIIGSDRDQFDEGRVNENNIILTSVTKDIPKDIEKSLKDIKEGNFEGKNEVKGIKEKAVGIVVKKDRSQLSSKTVNKIKKVKKQVKDGDIVPASRSNKKTPKNFKGL